MSPRNEHRAHAFHTPDLCQKISIVSGRKLGYPGVPHLTGGLATLRVIALVGVLGFDCGTCCEAQNAWDVASGHRRQLLERDARDYYVQDIWTRVTEANEDLVWDTPASVHVMFTWALGTRGLMQGLLSWAVRQ